MNAVMNSRITISSVTATMKQALLEFVIPAKAGIQRRASQSHWGEGVPSPFAGTTAKKKFRIGGWLLAAAVTVFGTTAIAAPVVSMSAPATGS